MRRIKIFSAFVLVALTLSAGVGMAWAQNLLTAQPLVAEIVKPLERISAFRPGLPSPQGDLSGDRCGNVNSDPLSSSNPLVGWQPYSDPDYEFTLEYPARWMVKKNIFQPEPLPDPDAILKRLTFTGAEGIIDLDIWLSHGRDLSDWLEWYGQTRYKLPITHPNAMVGGRPAVVFLQKGVAVDMMATFFTDGDYVYRVWYTITHNEAGLQAYKHMLDTFVLPKGKAIVAQLPEGVEGEARLAADNSGVVNPLVSSCCGYSSPGNPFPCCNNKGNCTWWVWYKYSTYVPFTGDAGTWWSQVPDYYGWGRSSLPHYGENIAWWSGSPGHVAYVANYTGGSSVYITEMFYCTSCYHARTISTTTPGGYLFVVSQPPP